MSDLHEILRRVASGELSPEAAAELIRPARRKRGRPRKAKQAVFVLDRTKRPLRERRSYLVGRRYTELVETGMKPRDAHAVVSREFHRESHHIAAMAETITQRYVQRCAAFFRCTRDESRRTAEFWRNLPNLISELQGDTAAMLRLIERLRRD